MNSNFDSLKNKLDSLKNMRERWVEANRENDFEDGIKFVLTEIYPDNTHFVYELLQNAEDAQASEVYFTLNSKGLDFEHNGTRLFSLRDIESITSIGVSSKRDEATSIGKFGVGFKAVFLYTNTPEINSGNFHFRIRDFVVPEVIELQREVQKTKFTFPFDHPKKTVRQAKEEIARGLRELGDNTLLFLKHIRKIQYRLPDDSIGTIERIEHDDRRIEIRSRQPEKEETSSYWLHFEKDVKVTDENETLKVCRIAIAYSLAEEERKKKQLMWKIVPLHCGEVSIYFPAEKEISNLRFHIHAPFASTVARDSIRDVQANKDLRDHLAKLVVESLETIRDREMLNVSFLAVLPNPDDNLPEFYEPIREAIVEAFCKTDLTPTCSGHNRAAKTLYRGPTKIAAVIGDDGLSKFTNYSASSWAANAPQENQREDQFIRSLEIKVWGWEQLANIFDFHHSNRLSKEGKIAHLKLIHEFIDNLDDKQLMQLYALLGEAFELHSERRSVRMDIVRTVTKNGVQHHAPDKSYFAPENDSSAPLGVFIVKSEVYSIGKSDSQKKFARIFLELIGVRQYSEKEEIHNIIRCTRSDISDQQHVRDVKRLIEFSIKNPSEFHEIWKQPRLNSFSFKANDGLFKRPGFLFVDMPYRDTGLFPLKHIIRKDLISGLYKDSYKESELNKFIHFIESVEVMFKLKVKEVEIEDNVNLGLLGYGKSRSDYKCSEDYSIKNLPTLLDEKSILSSRLIWNALIEADAKHAKARYKANSRTSYRESNSQLVDHLINAKWIPNKSGEFFSPAQISKGQLRDDFIFDNRNELLTAIGFGSQAERVSEGYLQRQTVAEELGFDSAEELEKWKKIKDFGISPDDIIAQYAQRARISQPEDSVQNPTRRQEKLLASIEDAPSKESVTRERSIQKGISKVTAEAKAYLRAKYKNADDQLVCQCCHSDMPFKLRSNEYYFEAVQCISDKEMRHFQNRLALCPNCAAMYQYARETEDADIRRYIIEHEADDQASSVEIPVRLAGRELTLRFVGKHWFDLKKILSK